MTVHSTTAGQTPKPPGLPPNRQGFRALVRRIGKWIAVAVAVLLVLLVPTAAFIGVKCYRPVDDQLARVASAPPAELPAYGRPEVFTFLTLPEWFIVYSTDEYARFIRHDEPREFPYMRSVAQYWSYYASVCDATRSRYAFEPGYHAMLGVIGVSFTVESGIRALYENSIGRLSERLGGRDTAEDAFAARVASEYGTFMHTVPWYQFPFGQRLTELWTEVPLVGPNLARKLERRLALTTEYMVKGAYGWLLGRATGSAYEPQDLTIYARVDHAPLSVLRERNVEQVQLLGADSYVIKLPRYEAFTAAALSLLDSDVRFLDIAGNDHILVSVVAPVSLDESTLPVGEAVASGPILTDARRKRVAVAVPVTRLHDAVPTLRSAGASIEHLYDY